MSFELLSSSQAKELDKQTMDEGVSGEALMETAGAKCVQEIEKNFEKAKTLVMAGTGNNGGDGFVIARILQEKGWDVSLGLFGQLEKLKGEAKIAADKYEGKVKNLYDLDPGEFDLVVDSIFGTGLVRNIEGELAGYFKKVEMPVFAVDMPSGVCSDTGELKGCALKVETTVTFQRKKLGQVLMPGREYCGKVIVHDIGLSEEVIQKMGIDIFENEPSLWLERFPWPERGDNKYSKGHAVIVGGGVEATGAARLSAASAEASLRAGAGLVTVVCDSESLKIYAQSLTAVMTKVVDEIEGFKEILADERKNAVLIGPGAGVNEKTKEMVLAPLEAGKDVVLDADSLTVFKDNPQELFEAIKRSKVQVVMTPHEGEFKRLFDFDGEKTERVRKASELSGSVVLLKGADTVIAELDGKVAINDNAPPTLATAGSGDVLAGIIVGLIAQGMNGFDAACAGAWIHGEAANKFGPGLIAEDLPDLIPEVLKDLQNY